MKFERLFEPVNIGKVNIKNRIAMAAMNPIGLANRDGGLSQRAIDYYLERAFGDVGLIIIGVIKVAEIEPKFGYLFINWESFPSFSEMAELLHCYGTKVFAQLIPGYGRNLPGMMIDRGFKPVSPSVVPAYWRPNVTTRALTTEEVEKMVEAFGNAAELLKAAGIDGIELQGYGGYLLDEFTTTRWNKRNDKYGGSLENRLKFPIGILNAIKDKAGKDFPVIYRFSVKHYMKGAWASALGHEDFVEAGRDIEEGLEMAKLLEKAGFDALHVNAGCYDSGYWAYPPPYQIHGHLVDKAAEVKKCVTVPVIAVGRLDIPELAEKVLREGKADMVALGRGLLADPHWPKKVHEGKMGEIRPCIACNDGCLYRISVDRKPLSCSVNPTTGKERFYSLEVANTPKKVLIVGGGIAGMEAGRVSAMKGHEVTLYERGEKLGGHLIAASVPEFKQDIRRLLDWYNKQLKSLGVEIRLQVEVTSELVKRKNPNRVILATGSKPIIPPIPGIEKPMVSTCIDLLSGKKKPKGSVVVIGGGLVGCDTALWLANQGRKVTVIEALPEIATGRIFFANRDMLLDLLREKNVEFVTNASPEEVRDEGVSVIEGNSTRKFIMCDTVALALGLKPEKELYESLRKECTELYMIGDCKEPGKIMDAIWDGYHIACR